MKTHQPKGGMCASCTKRDNDCSDLDFENMPVIGVSDSDIIVRCTESSSVNNHWITGASAK